ncbi:MAG: DUF4437 domain-containing protein [Acidobacteriota bacterium]
MRPRHVLAFAVSFLLAMTVVAQGSGDVKPATAPKAKAGAHKAVIMPAADLKWADIDPSEPGVQIADVWGDHTKGAFGAFIKFPAGFTAPLHTHTNDMKIVVISGTWIHGPEGKDEVRLGPGSYFMEPGGTYRHTTACDQASECLTFIQSNGKFDLKPVGGEKPAEKK